MLIRNNIVWCDCEFLFVFDVVLVSFFSFFFGKSFGGVYVETC